MILDNVFARLKSNIRFQNNPTLSTIRNSPYKFTNKRYMRNSRLFTKVF